MGECPQQTDWRGLGRAPGEGWGDPEIWEVRESGRGSFEVGVAWPVHHAGSCDAPVLREMANYMYSYMYGRAREALAGFANINDMTFPGR